MCAAPAASWSPPKKGINFGSREFMDDKFAHYVRKNDITESAVTGKAVTAICGKKWVPTRLPDDFPVCPDCKRIYEQLKPSK